MSQDARALRIGIRGEGMNSSSYTVYDIDTNRMIPATSVTLRLRADHVVECDLIVLAEEVNVVGVEAETRVEFGHWPDPATYPADV